MMFNNQRQALLLLLAVVAVGLVLAVVVLKPSWVIGSDGFSYYAYARSLIFDHDLDFTPERLMFDQQFGQQTATSWRTSTGRVGNPFAIGASILWFPFIVIAYFAQIIFKFSDPFGLPGYNLPFQIAIGVGTGIYVLAGTGLLFLTLRRWCSVYNTWLATIAIIGISALPYYLIYEPSMAHGLSFFATSLIFYFSVLIKQQKTPRWFLIILTGLAIGLVFLVRWQDVLFGFIPLTVLMSRISFWQRLQRLAVLTGSFGVLAGGQLMVWRYLYGQWLVIPQGSSFFQLNKPYFFNFLFSGHHGLFIIHPLLFFGVIGLLLALMKLPAWKSVESGGILRSPSIKSLSSGVLTKDWFTLRSFDVGGQRRINKDYRYWAGLLLIPLVGQWYLNSALVDWHGSGSFGARRMIGAYFIFAFGLAVLFTQLPTKLLRTVVVSLLAVGIFFNVLLMIAYARGIIKIDLPTTYWEVYTAPLKLFYD